MASQCRNSRSRVALSLGIVAAHAIEVKLCGAAIRVGIERERCLRRSVYGFFRRTCIGALERATGGDRYENASPRHADPLHQRLPRQLLDTRVQVSCNTPQRLSGVMRIG